MSELARRIDDLERRLRTIEESIALLTTRITCENGEVIVTGPLSVPIKEPLVSEMKDVSYRVTS